MSKELLSIIVPVYNVEESVGRAIESVLDQTYQNIELILIDDGSTDSSGQICDKYGERCKNIKVIHKKNEGVSIARNVGLENATGEYIAFLDSDDFIRPEMYEKMLEIAENQKSDVVCCGYCRVDENKKLIDKIKEQRKQMNVCGMEAYSCLIESSEYTTVVWNKIFARRIIFRNGVLLTFEKGLTVGEDELWLLKVIADNNAKVSFLQDKLYYWVQRSGSALHSGEEITKQRLDELMVRKQIYNMCKDKCNQKMIAASGALLYDKAFALYKISIQLQQQSLCIKLKPVLKETRKYWYRRKEVSLYEKGRNIYWRVRLKGKMIKWKKQRVKEMPQ